MKDKRGFAHIFLLITLTLVLLAAISLGKNWFNPNSHLTSGKLNGPDCTNGPIFTKIPIDPAKILAVTPLGNLNPPDHTTPTDHIYMVVKNNNEIHPEFATKVFSPSNITISRITHTTTKKSGKEFSNDYSIDFSPCKDIQAKFGHVTKLSSKLAGLTQKGGRCDTQHPRPEDEYTYCNIELNEKISSGGGFDSGSSGGGFDSGGGSSF